MKRLRPAQITQAIHAVEQLMRGYEQFTGDALTDCRDPGFKDYLNDQVAPTMTPDERGRYEGYLRTFFEVRLNQPEEHAPTIRPSSQAETEVDATTAMRYTQRAERLIARFEADTGESFSPESTRFAAYIGERLARVGASTRRTYRAALDYYYRAALDQPEGAPDFRAWMPTTDAEAKPPKPNKRVKGLPPAHAHKLTAALYKKGTFHARLAALTLESGIIFGLRPSEWAKARLGRVVPDDTGEAVNALIVENAKSTHGRSHSPTRTLLMDGVDDHQYATTRETIKQWIEYIEQFTAVNAVSANAIDNHQAIQAIINGTGVAISKATRKLKLKPYTLYSARHQFAANAKAAGCSPVEVAAMMGHAATTTAGEHYGKRRRGSKGGLLVRPAPQDIAAVEAKNSPSLEQRLSQITPRSQRGDDLSM